jgi:hypothetical protein
MEKKYFSIYGPFASSFELLKQGKALASFLLPEPFVSQAQGIPNL